MAIKWCPFYNVESAVGRYCPNQSQDVMLVQYFMRELGNHPDFTGMPGRPAKPCPVDGSYSEDTQAWINWFQQLLRSNALSVATDGRIDPARNPDANSTSTISHTRYTITHLNGSFRKRFHNKHDHLESDSSVPAVLRAKFKKDDAAV
jgi:hypothetical protein